MGSDDYKAMSREEQLQQTAEEWADYYKHAEDLCDYISIRVAYKEGAAWADKHPKNVWHSSEEDPKKNRYILIEVVDTLTPKNGIRYYVEYVEEWIIGCMKKDGFQCRWAYIKDLLPKGGEE